MTMPILIGEAGGGGGETHESRDIQTMSDLFDLDDSVKLAP